MAPQLLEERTDESLKRILALDPDVICLQEVHYKVAEHIESTLKEYYFPARQIQIQRVVSHKYSTLTFTKDRTAVCKVIPFQRTLMYRDILEVSVGGVKVVNVHLESTNQPQFRDIRAQQLTTIHTMYQGTNVVVCGDFNINGPVTSEGYRELSVEFSTFYAARFNPNNFEARFDHVLYAGVRCQFLSQVGNEPYSDKRYCSDHNGIVFTINSQ